MPALGTPIHAYGPSGQESPGARAARNVKSVNSALPDAAGNVTVTTSGGGGGVGGWVDNGDGSITLSTGPAVTDNGDGSITLHA